MKDNKENATVRALHPDAVGRETREVTRQLTEQELNDLRESFTDKSLEKQNAEDEFSVIRKEHMKQMKDAKSELRTTLQTINKGSITTAVDCDLVPDFTEDLMLYLDENHEIVHRRKLKPSERQTHIPADQTNVTIGKTGTGE